MTTDTITIIIIVCAVIIIVFRSFILDDDDEDASIRSHARSRARSSDALEDEADEADALEDESPTPTRGQTYCEGNPNLEYELLISMDLEFEL